MRKTADTRPQVIDSRRIAAKNIGSVVLDADSHVILARGTEGERHYIEVRMPWGRAYRLGNWPNEALIQEVLGNYAAALEDGAKIELTGASTADITYD